MTTTAEQNQLKDTKEIIFRTAAHLFAEKGYNGVSMREISEQSGVTKPTIYYYFGSKEGIYRQLIDTGLSHFFTTLERVNEEERPVKEKLVEMTKKLFDMAVGFPEFTKFFMTAVTPFSDNEILEKFKTVANEKGRLLVKMIHEGIERGEFCASAKPELAAEIIGGVWMHMIMKQLASKRKVLSDKLAEEIIELLFKGLNE